MSIDRNRSNETPDQLDIDFLAQESQAPIDVVARLYKDEMARLQAGARVDAFISTLAIRNVRRLLRLSGHLPAIKRAHSDSPSRASS
jgi:hypothetical protein